MILKILISFALVTNCLTTTSAAQIDNQTLPLSQPRLLQMKPNETIRLVLGSENNHTANIHEFWTFEAHSQNNDDCIILSSDIVVLEDLTLTNNRSCQTTKLSEQFPVLNHPGIVILRKDLDNGSVPFAYLSNLNDENVTMILLVRGYTEKYPIPGFVNNLTTSNSLKVQYSMDDIMLEFSPAGFTGSTEGKPVLTYSVYQHYLAERNLEVDAFLYQITNTMLLLDDILDNGVRINDDFVLKNVTKDGRTKVLFGAYPGTAVIFSVVVTSRYDDGNGTILDYSSVYATSGTYACRIGKSNENMNCQVMWYTITKAICGISVFAGAFLAIFGHRYYLMSQLLFGVYGTGMLAFITIVVIHDGILVSYTEQVGLSVAIGIIGGFLWTLVWYVLGIPVLSTAWSVMLSGLLFGGIFVYLPPMNIESMTSDTVYWLTIAAFIIGSVMVILPFTKTASILSCALIGTFIFIVPIDHYIGTSLKFIVVNLIRRTYVEGFNMAVLNYPFQTNDIALVCGWIGLAFVALMVQFFREKGRAPFPPNPYQLRRWRIELNQNALNSAEEETEPLLSSQNRPMSPTSYSPREAATDSGGYRPVVGYIQVANSRNYGTGGTALNTSPSVMRTLENPSLYNSQPREVAPQQQQSPRHFWSSRLNVEQTQSHVSRSVEERDLFQPPQPQPSQQPEQK